MKRSIGLVDNIQGVLLDNLVSNEPPVNIESDELSMQVEKVMIKDASQRNNGIKGAKFGSPSPGALGIGDGKLLMIIRRCLMFWGHPLCYPLAFTRRSPIRFNSMCLKPYPRADGAKRRARVLIPPGYLHPGKRKH